MGYIVQSIVFDKDKGWDLTTAREWVKNHKEFSKPIKEEETTNTIRVRLFPPKKAKQMGFKDYRMKTLASGDVGIMLDIAYNKLEGGMVNDDIQYEDLDPIEELRHFNSRLKKVISGIKRNTNYMRQVLTDTNFNLTNEERSQISNEMRLQEERIAEIKRQIDENNEEIKLYQADVKFGSGIGGSLANEDLQALLAKSYNSQNPSDYKDFQVDKELSGQRVQVYHNPTTQQTVVAHRGTQSVPNWIENVAYAVGNDKSGKAFQHSKKIQDQAYQKYGKENITTIGHSKGALHAQEYGKEGKEVITLNKPVNIHDALFTRVPKSQTDIRTQYDPVSFLRPFQRGNKAETIKSTTKNPLEEHKTSVLGRLDPRRLFGGVIIRFSNGDVDFDTSSPLSFYNSIKAYYFSERPHRSGEYQEALQIAPNFVNGREQDIILDFQINWDEFLDTLNGDNEMAKRRIISVTELQIGGIIDDVLEYDEENIYTDNEIELSSSDEEGAGMSGGNWEQQIAILGTVPFATLVAVFGIKKLKQLYDRWRRRPQVNPFDNLMINTTGVPSFVEEGKMGDNGAGRGMTGGANLIDITTNRITYNIDLSSKQGFYNTALPYYNAVNIRSYRIDGNMYAIRGVVDGVNEDTEWNRYYQETIIPKIIRSMKTTSSNDIYLKLETFRENMTKWADILREYLDFYSERDGDYPTAPNTPYDSDEDDEVQNPIYQEGAGMTGGIFELPNFDADIGRVFRGAKRRWEKSPKMIENIEYERKVFDAKYGKLMRYTRLVGGQGELDNTTYVELLMYLNWVKNLEIPEISKGAGKKAKKAKKTGKSKK